MTTADPMIADGQILAGTPLSRLVEVLDGAKKPTVWPMAGDVFDVADLYGGDDKIAAALKATADTPRPGIEIAVKASELRHLVGLAVGPRPASA